MADDMIIRTRFAPSPSGHLHVGGARTALFCWAYTRGRGGTFILRIEDTDQRRSSDTASMTFLEDLAWLGIDWDEGPFFQSQRLEIYREHIDRLVREGKAYPAFETPEELDELRAAARREKREYRYDRAALRLAPDTVKAYLDEGRPHVIRFKMPDEDISFHDEVRGDLSFPADRYDDFVILKRDGYPTYHFAVVVDDALMNVTHVIRGEEHLSNTPRHIRLQEALGFPRPAYGHLSTINNADGSKMSKRDKDKALRREVKERGIESSVTVDAERWTWWLEKKDHQLDLPEAEALGRELGVALPEINVEDFRRGGYLPGVLVNYLALLGWSPGGDLEKFDRDKLLAFNLDALQALTAEEFTTLFRAFCRREHPDFIERLDDAAFDLLSVANHARSKTLESPIASSRFFLLDDEEVEYQSGKPVRKALCKGEPSGYDHLEAVLPVLRDVDEWTVERLESVVTAYAKEKAEGKLGSVAQPLRIAVSGGTISPAIFETLAVLGKQSTLRRIERCLEQKDRLCAV